MIAYNTKCVFSGKKGLAARGGSSIIQVNDKLLLFGGATREMKHFKDLWVISNAKDVIEKSKEDFDAKNISKVFLYIYTTLSLTIINYINIRLIAMEIYQQRELITQ